MTKSIKKQLQIFLALIFMVMPIFVSCEGVLQSLDPDSQVEDDFLDRWASTNCGPQPYGSYYLFEDNPCPSGYRLPRKDEFEELISYPQRWSTSNNPGGVNGMWFGATYDALSNASASNPKGCLFFLAAEYSTVYSDGTEYESYRGRRGRYWSSTTADSDKWGENAWTMHFLSGDSSVSDWASRSRVTGSLRAWGETSVRCIRN